MKIKQFILINLFISLCQFSFAQMSEGVHYAYEIKKGQKIPDVITVTVVSHDEFCKKFINNTTKNLLEGKFFIVETGRAYFYVGNFSKGIPDGEWEIYYQDKLNRRRAYVNGKIEGDFYKYNADGTPYEGTSYKGGYIRHSISRHRNGQVHEETFYNEKGYLHGRSVTYNDEGKLLRDGTYEHGKKHGVFMEYDDVRETTRINEYKNGIVLYSKNTSSDGSITYEGFYNDGGKKHGRFTSAPNGYLLQEEIYQDGLAQQKKQFFKNGNLKSIIIYDENGKEKYSAYYIEDPYYMHEEHNYLDGKKHGLDKRFSRKDIVDKETYYHKGERIYEKYYDHDNGKINALYIVDETGHLTKVEEYNSQGKKTYKNTSYKKPSSIKLKEDASGIIDIEIE